MMSDMPPSIASTAVSAGGGDADDVIVWLTTLCVKLSMKSASFSAAIAAAAATAAAIVEFVLMLAVALSVTCSARAVWFTHQHSKPPL